MVIAIPAAVAQSGGFTHGGGTHYSPVVAELSSRKESKISFDLTVQDVNEDERIRQDEEENRDLDVRDDIDWTDTICDTRELLDEECRDLLKCTITCLMDRDKRGLTIADRNQLVNRANKLWDRAMNIPEECKQALEQEKNGLLARLGLRAGTAKQQYYRAAGSSLNSLAQEWAGYDEQEITAQLMEIAAKYHWEGVRFQNDALNSAFDASNIVFHEFTNSMMTRAVNLLGVLRGALDMDKREQTHDETRVRDEDEQIARDAVTDRDLDRTTTDFQTHWHRMAIDSNAAGTYAADVDAITGQQPQ